MALPFALRSRIRLREEPEPAHADWVPPVALPVAAYWLVMGLLTYGVSKGPAVFSELSSRNARPSLSSDDPQLPQALPAVGHTARRAVQEMPSKSPVTASSALEAAPSSPVAPKAATPPSRAVTSRALSVRVQAFHDLLHPDDALRWQTTREPEADSGDQAPQRPSRQPRDAALPRSRRRTGDDGEPLLSRHPRNDPPPAPARASAALPAFRAPLPAAPVATCESVLATASDEVDLTAARGAPDVSRDAYAAILENGGYLSSCAVPDGMALEVCAAVRGGRPVGVTVVTRPADGRISSCVRRAVASLAFPGNPRLDVTRTRFEAVRPR